MRHVVAMDKRAGQSMVSVHGNNHQEIAVCAALVPADIQNMIRSMWSCEAPCKEDPPPGTPVCEISPGRGLGIVSAALPGNALGDGTRADKRSKAGAMKVPPLMLLLLAMCCFQFDSLTLWLSHQALSGCVKMRSLWALFSWPRLLGMQHCLCALMRMIMHGSSAEMQTWAVS